VAFDDDFGDGNGDGNGSGRDSGSGAGDGSTAGQASAGGGSGAGSASGGGGSGAGGANGGGNGDPAASAAGNGGNGGGGGSGGGDTTGVSDDLIKIGFHAPLTGAAPVPIDSVRTGAQLYWQDNTVAGRNVEVIIRDDEFNPSRATQVCRELIEREEVWILLGGAGADGIAACARVAAQAQVPYLSGGVDEGQLRALPNYFTLSMSYVQQAPMLLEWIEANARPSNGRIAIIRDRTPSYNNALNRFRELATQAGYDVPIRQTQSGPADAQWLQQNDIEVAFPLMSPNQWLQIIQAPGGDIDQWVGIGLVMGLNLVAEPACRTAERAFDGAMALNPFPGLNQAGRLAPGVGFEDDLEFALWGASEALHQVFQAMGDDLSRENLVRTLESRAFEPAVYNPIRHTPDDHFGSQGMHVVRGDCDRNQWVTPDDGLFKSGF
jgi:branched-chain amino acid transport system substrate-binding protein